MKIHANMGLHELVERMGDGATLAEAEHMRATLDGLGRYSDTCDIPESEWLSLCEAAAAQAKLDEYRLIMDRNAMQTSSNWTGRTPRTASEAFPKTVRMPRTASRSRWHAIAAYSLAVTAGAALGAVVALFA